MIETRAWRERMFEHRAPESRSPYAPWMQKIGNLANQGIFPGMMGGQGQLALNQLLVVMDGIDNPPFMRRFGTNRINSFLDAVYIVPRRIGKVSLRLPPPRPLGAQIYFIGATNVPIERLDPALTRPGRMGRHVWFRTPTKDDRVDVFDLYLGKVAHAPELDTPEARDELARMTNGYSPAMIDQVCSMALTYAQHDGRVVFSRSDLVEAMTTIESGTAIGVESVPDELRATAVHEAGHALASHVYQKNIESTRLSVKMRGGSLGHFYGIQQEERFSRWRSEDIASLTMLLGAMAAEHVFYGENTNGVGGDVQSTTALAAYMVGASAMAPEPITITKKVEERDRRGDARADHEALREDRRADHEPHGRRRPVRGRPDRGRPERPRQARDGGADHRPGVHPRVPSDAEQQACDRDDRGHARREARDVRQRGRRSC